LQNVHLSALSPIINMQVGYNFGPFCFVTSKWTNFDGHVGAFYNVKQKSVSKLQMQIIKLQVLRLVILDIVCCFHVRFASRDPTIPVLCT